MLVIKNPRTGHPAAARQEYLGLKLTRIIKFCNPPIEISSVYHETCGVLYLFARCLPPRMIELSVTLQYIFVRCGRYIAKVYNVLHQDCKIALRYTLRCAQQLLRLASCLPCSTSTSSREIREIRERQEVRDRARYLVRNCSQCSTHVELMA